MTTLAWRRHAEEEAPPLVQEADTPVWPVLAELEVTTATSRTRGWIAPEGERTSDWMNRGAEIELIAPVEEVTSETAGSLAEPSRDPARVRLQADEILFAVPPELPVGRHLRLHRRICGIHFEIGPYEVRGRIHVRPGAEVGDYLLRSSRLFVPVTEVELVHHAAPAFHRRLPVLVVNSRRVTRLYSEDGEPVRATAGDLGFPGHVGTDADSGTKAVAEAAPASADLDADPPPVRGEIHGALAQLAALLEDGLVTEREYRAKRREILTRL